jgi:hypothetical protein
MKRTSGYKGVAAMTNFFLSFFEGKGIGRMTYRASISLASFLLAIHVHSSVDEVDNKVLRVNEFPALDLQEVVFAWGAGGCAICCLVLVSSEIFGKGFFSSGSAMRCRICFSSATNEMVLKQNTDQGRRAILHWKVTTIELAWVNVTPPTWRASCRCLEPDRAPGVTPRGAFG